MCSRPNSQAASASPRSGSTIQATPMPMSSAATWLGMRMPMPRPISAHRPEDEQAERQGAHDLGGGEGGRSIRVRPTAPTATDPTRLIRP